MSRLQAALDGVGEEPAKSEPKPAPKAARKPSHEKTILIGGHFPPEVQHALGLHHHFHTHKGSIHFQLQ